MEKEILYEGKVMVTSINIKEFSPAGARFDATSAGKVSGKVTGLVMTTHNALMKPGGPGEADVKSIIFSNGEPIMVWGKAKSQMVDPTPIQKIEENLTFQTSSQRLAYLNTTKGLSEGLLNLGTGEYNFKVYAVK
jgi:hypothetical protein